MKRVFLALALLFTPPAVETLQAYEWSLFAGSQGGPGTADGQGLAAKFIEPRDVAVDPAGNIYVSDAGSYTIRKISSGGAVTTIAGKAGQSALVDGTGDQARFLSPKGVAIAADGALLVVDGTAIRRVTSAGEVTTFAGGSSPGIESGPGTQARFTAPIDLAVDPGTGNAYVTDGRSIRLITPQGQVSTFAGSPTEQGSQNGNGTAARFAEAYGITLQPGGDLYVADRGNGVRRITLQGEVTTIFSGQMAPAFVAADAAGNLYFGAGGSEISKLAAGSGTLTTLAGGQSGGFRDGPGSSARFSSPAGLALNASGELIVADSYNYAIRKVTLAGVVATVAGRGTVSGSADGPKTSAEFFGPAGVAGDASGNLYVADYANHTIRKIAPDGAVTTIAGMAGQADSTDGTGSAARFQYPLGLAALPDGTLYLTDVYARVCRVSPAREVLTLAGIPGDPGFADGTGAQARFDQPIDLAVDASVGLIYVADANNQLIRTVSTSFPFTVATLAGEQGQPGTADGSGSNARFGRPLGAAVDAAGNLYITDGNNHSIRKVTSAGIVTTLAGPSVGFFDDLGNFKYPSAVAVDPYGNLFVADYEQHSVRKVTPTGRVITIGGDGLRGSEVGVGRAARFYDPQGVYVAADGSLYVTEMGNNRIVRGVDDSTEPPIFISPAANSTNNYTTTVAYELTEPAASGTVQIKFEPVNGQSPICTLTLTAAYATQGVHTFTFNPTDPAASSAVASVSPVGGKVFDARHKITLSYQDALGNAAASAEIDNVKFDTATLTPTLSGPLNEGILSSAVGGVSRVEINLPEAAKPGSVKLTLKKGSDSYELTIGTLGESAGPHAIVFNPAAQPPFAGNQNFPSVSGPVVPDGTYDSLTLSYQDALGNPAATVPTILFPEGTPIVVDTVTQNLTLYTPTVNDKLGTSITLRYSLPEPAYDGYLSQNGLVLSFSGKNYPLTDSYLTAGEHTVVFSPSDPVGTSNGAFDADYSAGAIGDGNYTVTLSYYDHGINPAKGESRNVQVDTVPPVLELHTPITDRRFSGLVPDYFAHFAIGDGSGLPVRTQTPPAGSTPPAGRFTVTLLLRDGAGNETTYVIENAEARPENPEHTVVFTASTKAAIPGSAVPDAGTFPGLPGDAKFSSVGVPSIDEQGKIAFLGKWTSVDGPAKKGSGLFTETKCLALIGGDAPISGAKYKTIADPVVSQGHVAFLATLSGVPKKEANVVVSDTGGNGLEIVAQSGTEAGADGATFKSFKGVQVSGNIVALFAQLTAGSGNPKVTAATDLGLWFREGSDNLLKTLREGDLLGSDKVKTAVSFAPGNGSPGQGRGWLIQPYGGYMPALVFLNTKPATQAIVNAHENGVDYNSLSGSATIGQPMPAGPTFKSYSFPTFNNNYAGAFLATLTPGGGVTKANAQGIFYTGNAYDTAGGFTTVARLGDPAGATGGNFSALKDPVLSSDNGLAFPATIKGTGIKGASATTLWYRAPDATETGLFAQGGHTGSGVPEVSADAEWLTFPSLAIMAARGPIFTATLKPGKGGVQKDQTQGVWAADYTGTLRLLVQTGVTEIDNKTVKSFTLLKALPGSTGVTRNFNDSGEVAWLATFTDGTTAIVKTEIP